MSTNALHHIDAGSVSGSSHQGNRCSAPGPFQPPANSVTQIERQSSYPRSGTIPQAGPVHERLMRPRTTTAPPATGYDVAGKQIPGRNLTGKVRKMSDYYFAAGGFADVWEGQLVEEPEEDTPGVRMSNILSDLYRFALGGTRFRISDSDEGTNLQLKKTKVAVKILRNITMGVPEASKERLAKVLLTISMDVFECSNNAPLRDYAVKLLSGKDYHIQISHLS